jgi:hypothetical protein
VSKAELLHDEGADEVIAGEFETQVGIVTVVLHTYFVPRDKIDTFMSDVRADGYQMLRRRSTVQGTLARSRAAYPHDNNHLVHDRTGFSACRYNARRVQPAKNGTTSPCLPCGGAMR